jgi:hypothetical protein
MVTPLSIDDYTKHLEEAAVFGVAAGAHADSKYPFERLTQDMTDTLGKENVTFPRTHCFSLNTALKNLAYHSARPLPLGLTTASSRPS